MSDKWIKQPQAAFSGSHGDFIRVDATKWYKELKKMEDKVQRKNTNTILRRTAREVYFPPLKTSSPVKTGSLRRSMGSITSKKRHLSTVFVGPRVIRGWNEKPDKLHRAMRFSGRIANVLEYSKGRIRRTRFRAIMYAQRHRAQAVMYRELRKLILNK